MEKNESSSINEKLYAIISKLYSKIEIAKKLGVHVIPDSAFEIK